MTISKVKDLRDCSSGLVGFGERDTEEAPSREALTLATQEGTKKTTKRATRPPRAREQEYNIQQATDKKFIRPTYINKAECSEMRPLNRSKSNGNKQGVHKGTSPQLTGCLKKQGQQQQPQRHKMPPREGPEYQGIRVVPTSLKDKTE